jgi:hypothetical protein
VVYISRGDRTRPCHGLKVDQSLEHVGSVAGTEGTLIGVNSGLSTLTSDVHSIRKHHDKASLDSSAVIRMGMVMSRTRHFLAVLHYKDYIYCSRSPSINASTSVHLAKT